jgi:hypothetical protein
MPDKKETTELKKGLLYIRMPRASGFRMLIHCFSELGKFAGIISNKVIEA